MIVKQIILLETIHRWYHKICPWTRFNRPSSFLDKPAIGTKICIKVKWWCISLHMDSMIRVTLTLMLKVNHFTLIPPRDHGKVLFIRLNSKPIKVYKTNLDKWIRRWITFSKCHNNLMECHHCYPQIRLSKEKLDPFPSTNKLTIGTIFKLREITSTTFHHIQEFEHLSNWI